MTAIAPLAPKSLLCPRPLTRRSARLIFAADLSSEANRRGGQHITITGNEKFDAAFSRDGTPHFPAAICYHGICLRDHWESVTDQPWWVQFDPHPERAALPWIDMIRKTGEDWFPVMLGASRRCQREVAIEATPDGIFRVSASTGERTLLERPPVGGSQKHAQDESNPPAAQVRTADELDEVMDAHLGIHASAADSPEDAGRLDLPRLLVGEFGTEKLPLAYLGAPCWRCYALWGFHGMMTAVIDFPKLIERACSRFLVEELRAVRAFAAAGARAIWVEDCMTDMLSPEQFRRFNLPSLRSLTDAIRRAGLWSVHYYCGRPDDRWELLLESGADALSLEESKKNFTIDIMEVAELVRGRMALLGNIDAIGLLERGTEGDLRREIARQCAAGRRNRNRFAVSLGSPVTPRTPFGRVRLYCDLVHELS